MKINKSVKISSFIIFFVLIILFINTDTFALLLDGKFDQIASSDGIWVLLSVTLFLMIIQNVLTMVPLVLLIAFNVTLFGYLYGYIWSLTASIIAGIISFYMARYWFQAFFIKRLNEGLAKKIERNGFAFVFMARLIPFMPTSLINTAAGVSSISAKHYTVSTFLGNMIYFFIVTLVIQGMMRIELEYAIFIGIVIVFAIIYIGYKMKRKNS